MDHRLHQVDLVSTLHQKGSVLDQYQEDSEALLDLEDSYRIIVASQLILVLVLDHQMLADLYLTVLDQMVGMEQTEYIIIIIGNSYTNFTNIIQKFRKVDRLFIMFI